MVKRYEAKWNKGWLLGKIQWLVFSWFFDRSKEIEKIGSVIPKPENIFSTVKEILKMRISYDIQKFDTSAPVPVEERVRLSMVTPTVIKQSWLTKFAQDKFDRTHTVSEEAKGLRTEIIELTEYLSAMDKIKEEREKPVVQQESVVQQEPIVQQEPEEPSQPPIDFD